MKMKRTVRMPGAVLVGILLLLCFCTRVANASSGNITVKFLGGVDSKILYLKVATMYNGEWQLDEEFKNCQVDLNVVKNGGQLSEAAEKMELYVHENQIALNESEKNDLNNHVCVEQLEKGLYLVMMEENDRFIMSPTLVALPGWTGEEMSYDVTVVPKIAEKNIAPKTGWNSKEGMYAGVVGTAFAIIVLGLKGKHHGCSK